MNMAQLKSVNLFKTLEVFCVITCHSIFNVWPKTVLLPVWPRDTPGILSTAPSGLVVGHLHCVEWRDCV